MEQRALARWLDARRLLWCHVPNGGQRNVLVAMQLRAEGVKPGVPDVLIFSVPPRCPEVRGVAVELKRQRLGRVAPAQAQWLEGLARQGWIARVCAGAQEAVDWLMSDMGY